MSLVSTIALKSIARGLRIPIPSAIANFRQWSELSKLLRDLEINVFLDVGANRGFYSKHLRECGYTGHLFSFEPIPSDCDQIEQKRGNDPKWKVIRCALGSETGVKQFNLNLSGAETVLSSFLPFKGGSAPTRTIEVQIRRLDDVLPDLIRGIADPRIFLKMDTQGFDGEVLTGAASCMSQIIGIQSEIAVIPLYDGMPSYIESLARYKSEGFDLRDLFVVSRTADGRVLEYDCIMSRTV